MALHHTKECATVRQASADTIVVPVVVDTGGSDSAQVSCISVAAGSNGAQVLAVRAKMLGVPPPRYAVSGLLCAIDGYPATGCGQQNGSHYAYWAYFHGGSSWTYASVGPASWPVSVGDVEGWRFEPDGSATPSDPPPRSPSDAATLCPASTTTTVPPNPPPTTTPPSPSTTAPVTSRGHGATTGGSTSPSTGPRGPKPFVAAPGGSASSTAPSTAPTSSVPSSSGRTGATTSRSDPPGASTVRHLAAAKNTAGSGGFPYGLLIAGMLIALLAVGALVRARRPARTD